MTVSSVAISPFLVGVVLLVHELGHYIAGAIAGIPSSERRLVLTGLPPHVALRDGGEWVSPFQNERFSRAYGQFDPERRYSRLFTAGGFLAQIVVIVPVAAAIALQRPPLGIALLGTSIGFVLVYLVIDIVMTLVRGQAFGDSAHLWRLHPPTAVSTLGVVLISHLGMLALIR